MNVLEPRSLDTSSRSLPRVSASEACALHTIRSKVHAARLDRLRTPLTQTAITFKNLTMDQVYESLSPLGVQPRLARLLQVTAVRKGEYPDRVPGVSGRVLDQVRQRTTIPHLTLVDKLVSPQDGFAKYLFRGERPEAFEAVRIPLSAPPGRSQVCGLRQFPGRLCDGLRILRDRPHGLSRQPGRLGNRRSGGQDPGRLAPSGPRRGLHGHGRADAQLCQRDAGGHDPFRVVRHGDRRQGDHDFDGRDRARHSPLTRPSGAASGWSCR